MGDEHRSLAERRVRLGLLLADVGQRAQIQVSDGRDDPGGDDPGHDSFGGQERAFFEFVQKNATARQQIQAPLFEDKVVDYVLELAQVSEKEVSKDELKAAVDALEEA